MNNSLPNINSNNRKYKNKFGAKNNLNKNIKPVTYYKYDEWPSNLSQLFFNNQSSQSTFPTNIKKNNSNLIPIDNKYYSTINITKKLPLSRNLDITHSISKNDSYYNNCSSSALYSQNKNIIYGYNIEKSKNQYKSKDNENNKSLNVKNNNIIVDAKMMKMDAYMRKIKQKMKKTRFKLHKIIINNRRSTCNIYDKKNDIFNGKLYNYLNSNSFYEKNKKFHRIFHFGKNDLNIAHDFTKHYVEPYNQEKNTKLTSKLVLKLLNEEDIKLIHSDPYFFLKDNKYLYKLTNTKYRTLQYRLKIEENSEQNNNNNLEDNKDNKNNVKMDNSLNKDSNLKNKNHHSKSKLKKNFHKNKRAKSQENEDRKLIYDGILLYNKKYIDKIINEDLNKRLKEIDKKKNQGIEKEMRDTVIQLNNYKKKDYIFESNNNFYKTYNDKTNINYFKPFYINKNYERLIKEKLFLEQRNKKNSDDNKDKNIISKYRKILEKNYKIRKQVYK